MIKLNINQIAKHLNISLKEAKELYDIAIEIIEEYLKNLN